MAGDLRRNKAELALPVPVWEESPAPGVAESETDPLVMPAVLFCCFRACPSLHHLQQHPQFGLLANPSIRCLPGE